MKMMLHKFYDDHAETLDFDTTYDEKMEEVMDLPCRKIWSTRTDFSANGLCTVPINQIEDSNELFQIYFFY